MTTITYNVTGMTCDHCVSAVTQEVKNLPGVSDVSVELESGAVTVTSDAVLDEATVRAAVEEAGYELTS